MAALGGQRYAVMRLAILNLASGAAVNMAVAK